MKGEILVVIIALSLFIYYLRISAILFESEDLPVVLVVLVSVIDEVDSLADAVEGCSRKEACFLVSKFVSLHNFVAVFYELPSRLIVKSGAKVLLYFDICKFITPFPKI